jgi:site-specific DNA-cytosine methylase
LNKNNTAGLNVLSLFDGMSAGMIALERANIPVSSYYASEIDKHAIKVSQANYPEIIRIGDVTKVSYADGLLTTENGKFYVGKIDLVIGGSPCQSISNMGDGSGLEGKSGLFYHYLRILDEVKPTKFLLENVVGNKSAIAAITREMGVQPTLIDSNLVSAQNRKRYYWTDINDVSQPSDKGILLKDILEDSSSESSVLSESRLRWLLSDKGQATLAKRYANLDGVKAACITARSDASWNSNYVTRNGKITKLSCVEYERLQTVPDNYTACVSDSQRYKVLGNGWTVDVIAHIFKGIEKKVVDSQEEPIYNGFVGS